MANSTYVCFACRTTDRDAGSRITRRCRRCRAPAEYVYWKFKIPKASDDAGWVELENKVRPMNRATKARVLATLEKDRLNIERVLATVPVDNEARRRSLEAKLSIIRKQVAEWQQWDQ